MRLLSGPYGAAMSLIGGFTLRLSLRRSRCPLRGSDGWRLPHRREHRPRHAGSRGAPRSGSLDAAGRGWMLGLWGRCHPRRAPQGPGWVLVSLGAGLFYVPYLHRNFLGAHFGGIAAGQGRCGSGNPKIIYGVVTWVTMNDRNLPLGGYEPSFTDVQGALSMLAKAAKDYDDMVIRQRALLAVLVRDLRDAGASWREIGDAAGISHVAAMKRWRTGDIPVNDVLAWDHLQDLVDDDERG